MNQFAKCCSSKRTNGKKKIHAVQVEKVKNQEQESQEFNMDTVDIDSVDKNGSNWIQNNDCNEA